MMLNRARMFKFLEFRFLFSLGLFLLKFFHIRIKNFPLINFKRKLNRNGCLCTNTFISYMVIHSLALSIIVIKFISKCFFYHSYVVNNKTWIFSFLLSFSLINHILFNFIYFILYSCFISIF